MKSFASIIILLGLLAAPALSAACRAISTFNKQIAGKDVPSLEDTFESGQVMGEGSFGKVVAVQWPYFTLRQQTVAIKRLNLKPSTLTKQVAELNKEVGVMKILGDFSDNTAEEKPAQRVTRRKGVRKQIKDIGVVNGIAPSMIDCLIDKKGTSAYVVMELLSGTLDTACFNTKKNCPARQWARKSQPERLIIFGKIANALQNMHSTGYVHDDLKPDNIGALDMDAGDVKLIDFGLSRQIGKKVEGGTDVYMDYPKLRWFLGELDKKDDDDKELDKTDPIADVYSLGIIMVQMEYAAWAVAQKKATDPDLLATFTYEAGQGKTDAEWFYNKVIELVTNADMLYNLKFYLCVVPRNSPIKHKVCLYRLFFRLIHPDRAQRISLSEYMTELSYFITHFNEAAPVHKNEIIRISGMDLVSAIAVEPKLVGEKLLV